ncbi:peptide ABC transporter substrate-binding protein [Sphaerisporangium melleum]|uniref:Peptide ABC transporter substrate-binding protein n=1 Tax=Sphaerisporangium melleum TaxID=321316 RepID=A0A917VVS3_9ACTN|nr:ABC transporter substrate-binding protein [Sphaerisporangium melleum]GGL19306.1 peptide ABC transporter substrate-binding protein [Sphaerisporangium melleum]GII74880.1 peptide ABC transporter substrate-binding protein [Sphaerisporangium melleum]
MRVTKGAQIVAGTALLALAVAACGGGGSSSGTGSSSSAAGNAGAVRVEIAEPQHDLIPGNTTETSGAEVLNALFVGLVDYDADKKPYNRVAESIESTDSTTWTIKLKDGYKWHNGEPVTAQNFVDSWNFTANGANAQEGNYFFGSIKGYDDLNPGEGKTPTATTLSGLKVVDDKTFTVELKNPFSGFPTMLGYTAFYPLPKAAFESEGKLKADFGGNPIGNGPFKISKPWKRGTDQTISLVRDDNFKEGKAKVDAVDFKIYTDLSTAFNDLRAGNLDIMDQLPPEGIATAKNEFGDRYIEQPSSGIGYIGFPTKNGADYAKNADVRKAISMAIDRKTITETVFSGTRVPADDFISPVVSGYRQGACGEACTYDPAKAKALFDQAGGAKMGTIEIGYNADGGHKEWIEAVANNLRTNLGVEVTPKPVEKFAAILEDLGNKKWSGAFRMAWIMDYPSPENYLRPQFGSGGSSNYSGFASKEFDDLVTQGDAAKTLDEGIKFYQQADDLVLKEMPYIPVYFYQTNGAYSQHVKNVKIDPFERIDLFNVEKA